MSANREPRLPGASSWQDLRYITNWAVWNIQQMQAKPVATRTPIEVELLQLEDTRKFQELLRLHSYLHKDREEFYNDVITQLDGIRGIPVRPGSAPNNSLNKATKVTENGIERDWKTQRETIIEQMRLIFSAEDEGDDSPDSNARIIYYLANNFDKFTRPYAVQFRNTSAFSASMNRFKTMLKVFQWFTTNQPERKKILDLVLIARDPEHGELRIPWTTYAQAGLGRTAKRRLRKRRATKRRRSSRK